MTDPRATDRLFLVQALGFFALFVGVAWAMLRITSGSTLGILIGPIAAQTAMALVILVSSRMATFRGASLRRAIPRRRLQLAPLVLVALGGFLLQATLISGFRSLTLSSIPLSSIPGASPEIQAPLMWMVILLTSVVGAPLLEEVFFRGMLLPFLSRRNLLLGLLLSAGLFGLAHGFEVPFRAVPTFLQGLVLGGVMLLTGRLRAAVLLHALNNGLVLVATLLLTFSPAAFVGKAAWPASVAFPAYALVALSLLGWGFVRIARQPHLRAA